LTQPLRITLITTGGTLDGTCHDIGVTGGPSLLRSTLESDPSLSLGVHTLFNKDSRDIDEEDRKRILDTILNESSDRILIGHGTYTICETGRFLKNYLNSSSKRVLLLGAWIPLEYPNSDAPAQIKYAIEAIRSCPAGVFIAMDGRLWDPLRTQKQKNESGEWELSEFET
jgi:L-asparaginase